VGAGAEDAVSKRAWLLARITRGHVKNVAFRELQDLVEAYGFHLRRVTGSHHFYAREGIFEALNFQSQQDGDAKPYQIRQFLSLVERYGLKLEEP
jgi:hypothetical protein